ncbi:MAG: hypothetical protein ACRES8_00065 [Nevskiaceae bacterium]
MSAAARAELQRLLEADADLLEGLSDGDAERLHALIESARGRQRAALREAQQHALRFVPAILRKPLLALMGAS